MRKTYTVGEANRTLPYVAGIVAEVRERYRAIRRRGREHNRQTAPEERERAELKREIKEDSDRIQECMKELDAIGAELKDYEMGLVDFPAELEGRAILLCWKHGERQVGFWHEPGAGYLGRQPIPKDHPDWPRTATQLIRGA